MTYFYKLINYYYNLQSILIFYLLHTIIINYLITFYCFNSKFYALKYILFDLHSKHNKFFLLPKHN